MVSARSRGRAGSRPASEKTPKISEVFRSAPATETDGSNPLIPRFQKVPVLSQGQATGLGAGDEGVVDKGVAAGRGDPPQVLVVEIPVDDGLVLGVTKDGAADGRGVQVGDVEVDEDIVGLGQRFVVHAGAVGAGEQFLNLGVGQAQAADHAVFQHLGKGNGFVDVG